MNTLDVLMYGNRTVGDVLDILPLESWETEGVCGVWSSKNIVAHLTSYEWVLADILRELEAWMTLLFMPSTVTSENISPR